MSKRWKKAIKRVAARQKALTAEVYQDGGSWYWFDAANRQGRNRGPFRSKQDAQTAARSEGYGIKGEDDQKELREGRTATTLKHDLDPSKLEFNGMRADSLDKSKYNVGDRVYNGSSWGDVMGVQPGGFGGETYRVKLDSGEVVTAKEGNLRRSADDVETIDKIPLDVGAKVDTPRGAGKIIAYSQANQNYQVDVDGDKVWFGKEQLTRKAIDDPDAAETEAIDKIGVRDVHIIDPDGRNRWVREGGANEDQIRETVLRVYGKRTQILEIKSISKGIQYYKGWKIESVEGTQVGYRLPDSGSLAARVGISGNTRQANGFEITYPDSGGTKYFDTLRAAKKYIDDYGEWDQAKNDWKSLSKSFLPSMPVTDGHSQLVVVKSLSGRTVSVRGLDDVVREVDADSLTVDRERFCQEDWVVVNKSMSWSDLNNLVKHRAAQAQQLKDQAADESNKKKKQELLGDATTLQSAVQMCGPILGDRKLSDDERENQIKSVFMTAIGEMRGPLPKSIKDCSKHVKQGPVVKANDPIRVLTFVMTTDSVDREGEVVEPDGMEFGELPEVELV